MKTPIARSPLRDALTVELARAGLTQRDLARRMGVPPTTLSTWLTEAHPPPPDLRARIAAALALDPTRLMPSR